MTDITQCPQCGTRFKVSQEQRESHQGMVRCGRCQAVFNAAAHLYDDTPSPQLALPIEPVEPSATPHAEAGTNATTYTLPAQDTQHDNQDFSYLEDIYEAPQAAPPRRNWPWVLAFVILLCALLLQATYFYRTELASRLPALKPAMVRICTELKCSIPLPRQIDLLSLESSSMETDPAQPNTITLSALLRNRATYALAYPDIELTLTNFDDKPVARRTFLPEEYLPAGEDGKAGLLANHETSVKLHLNTADLKPAGYRLYLLYPQK